MIMSVENLSRLERRILQALEVNQGDWLTRAQIAEEIGRESGYTPNDVRALKTLMDAGLVEAREKTIGVAKMAFEYRVKVVSDGS